MITDYDSKIIEKYVSQKCLGYDANTGKNKFHIVAEFRDGKTREIVASMASGEIITGSHIGWTEVK